MKFCKLENCDKILANILNKHDLLYDNFTLININGIPTYQASSYIQLHSNNFGLNN